MALTLPHDLACDALQVAVHANRRFDCTLKTAAVGLDMRLWWTPAAAFLSRLSKADIADVMREAG